MAATLATVGSGPRWYGLSAAKAVRGDSSAVSNTAAATAVIATSAVSRSRGPRPVRDAVMSGEAGSRGTAGDISRRRTRCR
ncbi:hypothetical protein GCM10010172_19590 [Paractinoplanes ferrugineus]|uniref:Uncharacterized protein n=1 Tax=Paractinoplanes ferrugineus TaxID=113564 RepID=A0A919J7Y5_9ACTN|nr:hypothetical protein Afe05nite_80500 [Actinoplanes ferrugineus]